MAGNREIQLIIKAVDKASAELRSVSGGVKKLGDEAKASSTSSAAMGDALRGIAREALLGVAGLAAFGVAAKKAFDFAEEGAKIQQTGESFDMLMDALGAAPNILQQMKDAVGGTVDEMSLMSSTMTLVAGASSELAISMVDAAPRLLEIAKAANKLNPSLGSTTFLYESLARGIKRSSPLILDNTGLVIKVGEANQAYADSLGVTVEALTATDKQQALLNAALSAGAVLIDQVGGNTDSAADSFARLTTRTKEAGDALKSSLAPAGSAVVESLEKLFFWNQVVVESFTEIEAGARDGADSWDEYAAAISAGLKDTNFFIDQSGALVDIYGNLYKEQAVLTESQWALNEAVQASIAIVNASGNAIDGWADKWLRAQNIVIETPEEIADAADALADSIEDAAARRIATADRIASAVEDSAARQMSAYRDLAGDIANIDVSTEGMWREMSDAAIAAGATTDEIIRLATETGLATEAEARMAITRRDVIASTEAATLSTYGQILAMQHMDEWQRLTDESATLLAEGETELAAAAELAAEKELALVESLIGSKTSADEAKVAQGELIGEYDRTPDEVSTDIIQEEMAYARSQAREYKADLDNIPRSITTTITQRFIISGIQAAQVAHQDTRGQEVPELAAGMPYVQQTGLAYLHQGEAVLPRDEAQDYRAGRGGGGTIIIAPIILERSQYTDANGELMFQQIAEMIQAQQGAF